jgi:hypothetical protein
MASSNSSHLLPLSLLEQQLAAIDLLLSMFSFSGELELSSSNAESIRQLRVYLEEPSSKAPRLPLSLEFILHISVDLEHELQLHIQLPLSSSHSRIHEEELNSEEPPPPVIAFRCPAWMNRKTHSEIVQRMPTGSPDSVLEAVEYLKEEAAAYISSLELATLSSHQNPQSQTQNQALVRVWFYLQSLSTRSKRDDMVKWAPGYNLTGFVLAGKPGILCLEGTARDIDAYMSDIKTRSWSDVPSHQKKVSERYREEGIGVKRVFRDMREVTGEISKGGHRGNRGEMGEVKALFEEVGLGEVFAEVLGL